MKLHKCPLCGHEFEKNAVSQKCDGGACCGSCSGCTALRCPNCGYALAEESALIKWISGIFKSGDQKVPGTGCEKK